MNKPTKKILYFITKSNWGGTQKYVYDLATNLVINSDEIISNHTTLTTGDDGLALDSASKSKLFYNFEVVVYAGLSGNSNILFEKIDEFNSKVATVGRHLGMVKKGSLNKIRTARLNLHNDFNIWKSFFNLFEFYKILKSVL